jgi:hypothetical protein
MFEDTHYDRRRFLGLTAMTIAAAHLGTRDVTNAQSHTTPQETLTMMNLETHT